MVQSGLIETQETLIIETPERVQLEFALASIGNRFIAVVIDHFIQILSVILLVWGASNLAGSFNDLEMWLGGIFAGASRWIVALGVIAVFGIFSGYFIFFEWLWNGQTPGKRLMRLRVIREDGRPVTLWEVLARNLIRIIDNFPGTVIPLYSVGLIALVLNPRDQRLGDAFAGTVVVRERRDDAPTFAEAFESGDMDAAVRRVMAPVHFSADLKAVSEREVEVAEAFLRRRWEIGDKQRTWLAWRVALPIMYRLRPEYESEGFSYEGFLEELVHRYRERERAIDRRPEAGGR